MVDKREKVIDKWPGSRSVLQARCWGTAIAHGVLPKNFDQPKSAVPLSHNPVQT